MCRRATSKSYASVARARDAPGYNVEIAWYLGEHARANGSKFGFDFGINEADASSTRQCRVFWNTASRNRTTNDNREWGTVILAGYDGSSPMQLDTFMLGRNIAKANCAGARDLEAGKRARCALARAKCRDDLHATSARSTRPTRALDTALRGLAAQGARIPIPTTCPRSSIFRIRSGSSTGAR